MSVKDLLDRADKLYREAVLTDERVKVFREEFTRLQDKTDRLARDQLDHHVRLVQLETKVGDIQALRDKVGELDARFKASVEAALLATAREGVREETRAYLEQHQRDLLAGQPRNDGHARPRVSEG